MRTKSRKWLLTALISAMWMAACGDAQNDDSFDDDEEVVVAATSSALAEGRPIQVVPAAGLSGYKAGASLVVDPRDAARGAQWTYAAPGAMSWLDLVVASCDVPVRSLYGDPTTSGGGVANGPHLGSTSPVPSPATGFFVPTPASLPVGVSLGGMAGSPIGYWAEKYSDRPWLTQALLLCAGQKSLELAQALRTTYIVGFQPDPANKKSEWIIATENKNDWSKSWHAHEQLLRGMAATKAFKLPTWDAAKFKTLFEIPAANAEQAATWSLLAVDFFRESALVGSQGLDAYRTRAGGAVDLSLHYAELADGKRLTLDEVMVSNLSDAMLGMEDAAERAQLYVAAATKAGSETESDRVQAWRGRFGSRLEAARVFAGIDPKLFQGWGVVPFYRMVSAGTATGANGVKQEAMTTNPAAVEANWTAGADSVASRVVIGYVYPPYLSQPEGTEKLVRRTLAFTSWTGPESLLTGAANGANTNNPVLEGYVPIAKKDPNDPAPYPDMLDLTNTGSGSTFKLVIATTQSTTTSNKPAVFGRIVKKTGGTDPLNIEMPTLSGLYPVVEALSESNRDRIAENTIRSLRVSPVVCTTAEGCNVNKLKNIDTLIDDMRLAETARLYKQSFWPTGDDYLADMPFNKESYVRNAALRIVQEAQVLGRAIVVEQDSDGVERVRGTRKDLLPVEAAYLQARTDGATRFNTLGTADTIDVEFARRGVHQAALYVRRQLELNPSSHPGISETINKLKGWVDSLANGYVRVTLTPATVTVGGQSVSVADVELHVQETRPTQGTYELWLGEDGLECALRGTTSGLSCDEKKYNLLTYGYTAAGSAEERIGKVSANAKLRLGRRVYLTKNSGAQRRAVMGTSLPMKFDTTGTGVRLNKESRRLPLITDTIALAYRDTLAADPEDSYRAEKFCNGLIDYDIRVKLEDKLTGTSALDHAMESASTAALRADTFGDQVVLAGLEMDQRSEIAQDALEDLCGATTELETLPTGGQPPPENEDPLNTVSGSSGLDACMTPEKDLEWLSAGTAAHCAWQLAGQPFCECGADTDCQAWVKGHPEVACPVSPLKVNDAVHDRTNMYGPDDKEREQSDLDEGCDDYAKNGDWLAGASAPPAALKAKLGYKALKPAGHSVESGGLGEMPLSDIQTSVAPPAGWESASTRCEMLAALYSGAYEDKDLSIVRQAFPWLDFDTVRDTAGSIGLRVDPLGLYELTLDGEPWLKVGSLSPMPFNPDPVTTGPKQGVSPADRRWWPGVTTPWTVADLVRQKVCTSEERHQNFLYCRGFDWVAAHDNIPENDGAGGEREAMRIEAALLTLEHLTGAVGTRDDWEWDSGAESEIGRNKQYVTDVIQIGKNDPEGRHGAFGCIENSGNNCTSRDVNDVFFGLKDDVTMMATDTLTLYPIPGDFDIGDEEFSYVDHVNPANWVKTAAFRAYHEDRAIDEKFDADEFTTNSTIWNVLADADSPSAHRAIEWTYHPPKKKKWWQKAKDWTSVVILADVLTGGGVLGGAGLLHPQLATASALNLGNTVLRKGRGKWTKETWSMERQDLFDAFSLVCMALDERDGLQPVQSVDTCATYFTGEPTLRDAANGADCVARRINTQFDELYIPSVPPQLSPTLMVNSGEIVQITPEFAGQYAEAVSTLNADLEIYRSSTAAMSRAMNDLGYHTRSLSHTIKRLKNDQQIKDLQLWKDISNQMTACVTAGASSAGIDFVSAIGRGAAATATCVNSGLQIMWSMEIDKLQDDNFDLSKAQQLEDFKEAIENVLARIDEQMVAVRQSHSRIHGSIAAMAGIRARARRAESRAKLEWDLGNGRVNNVNAVMRARMNTNLFRYEEAWRQAVRYGFMARKAVEQRFGVHLDTMTHRMSLFGKTGAGQAPYEWADTICYKRGIDYERIRSGQSAAEEDQNGETDTTSAANSERGYADSYITDYVTKLDDFIESYRVDFPFDEGSDTVVISVRDELKGVRRLDCSVEGPNYLLNTSKPASTLGYWTCGLNAACAALEPTDSTSLEPIPSTSPLSCTSTQCESWQKGVRPAKVTAQTTTTVAPGQALNVPASVVEQEVAVDAGTYTMSWYERCDAKASVLGLRYTQPAAGSLAPTPKPVTPAPCTCATCPAAQKVSRVNAKGITETWVRRSAPLHFNTSGFASVGFELPAKNNVTPTTKPFAIIAAPQLEAGPMVSEYFPTDNDFEAPVGICEDTTGEKFRSHDLWSYKCETYCPAGYGLDCERRIDADELPKSCFYELHFALSQEDIERGRLLNEAGFSKGNFNYRVDNLAVNFVGTGVKSCEGAELSSACNGGQFLQYSLHQSGPFRVRNYEGDLYAAPLFAGNIQMAKGLTAERYLTNPISSADQSLLSAYWRNEFKERPLDGEYTLRVYDSESLQWSHLEDVQIVMNYSYWTRSR